MATIDQIYRDNLRLLVKEAGTQEALSAKIQKSAAQISQWLNASKDSKTGKPRSMSRNTAREIERVCGKPEGWMDQQHEGEPHTVAEPAPPYGASVLFEQLKPEEQQLLENFRTMLDDDQRHFAEEIAARAAKMRAYTAKVLERVGASSKPAKTSADAARTQIARAALELTDRLRQEPLLENDNEDHKK